MRQLLTEYRFIAHGTHQFAHHIERGEICGEENRESTQGAQQVAPEIDLAAALQSETRAQYRRRLAPLKRVRTRNTDARRCGNLNRRTINMRICDVESLGLQDRQRPRQKSDS